MNEKVTVLVPKDTRERLTTVREKLSKARLELVEHPSYGNAVAIQTLTKELNMTAKAIRDRDITLAFNFEHKLLEQVG